MCGFVQSHVLFNPLPVESPICRWSATAFCWWNLSLFSLKSPFWVASPHFCSLNLHLKGELTDFLSNWLEWFAGSPFWIFHFSTKTTIFHWSIMVNPIFLRFSPSLGPFPRLPSGREGFRAPRPQRRRSGRGPKRPKETSGSAWCSPLERVQSVYTYTYTDTYT